LLKSFSLEEWLLDLPRDEDGMLSEQKS